MEEFSLGMELNEVDARQDKISLHLGNWKVRANATVMNTFAMSLGYPDRVHPTFGFIAFRQHNDANERWIRKIEIFRAKQGRGYKNNAPLFTGELIIKYQTNDQYKLYFLLDINPTRFCAYQPTPLRNRRTDTRILPNSPILFVKQNRNSYGRRENFEYTLDKSDNCLLSAGAKINGSQQFYTENFNRYLDAIVRYFEDEIYDFIQPGFSYLGKDEFYSIRDIETYWDIPCESPITTVRRLEQIIRTSTNLMAIHEYELDTDSTDNHESVHEQEFDESTDEQDEIIEEQPNARAGVTIGATGLTPCYTCYFRKGESLKVYAKTNKRIRIEVKYDFYKQKTLKNNWGNIPTTIPRLHDFINYCCALSTETANYFLNCLNQNDATNVTRNRSIIDFITKIYSTTESVYHANSILRIMAAADGITSEKVPQHLKSSLDRLVNKGILIKQSGLATKYIPSRMYLAASRNLIK